MKIILMFFYFLGAALLFSGNGEVVLAIPIIPLIAGGVGIAGGIKSLLSGDGNNNLQQIAESGFSPEELEALISILNLNIGAEQRQGAAITRQSTAGAPKSTQRAASAKFQNETLMTLLQGIQGIQGFGVQRRLKASLGLAAINKQNRKGVFDALASIGISVGSLFAGKAEV